MKVLCVGMMVCDTLISSVPFNILELDSVGIPKPVVCCGGDALNTALGLAKLGNQVAVAGRIGDDGNGRYIVEQCRQYGIDAAGLVCDEECATAASYALIDENGERHFLTEKAIFAKVCNEDVSDRMIQESDCVYIGSAMALRKMDESGIRDIFGRARRMGKLTVMDAAVNREDPEKDWLSYLAPAFQETDVFFPSMEEAAKITNETEPEKIAECFRPFGMKLFGIKLGADGCFATDFKRSKRIACPPDMPVVDTTGAGDSFMAGLISGLGRGWDSFTSARFAVCVATLNVGAVGGTTGVPDFETANRFFIQNGTQPESI